MNIQPSALLSPLSSHLRDWLLIALLCGLGAHSLAAGDLPDPDTPPKPAQYVLGATLASSPAYNGASDRKLRLRPTWAVQWGRLRFSTSQASALLSSTSGDAGSGMMADLTQLGRWSFSAGLRTDAGREASSSPVLLGTHNISPTIRGRVVANYRLTPQWSTSAGLSQDLLGKHGGMASSLDVQWHTVLDKNTALSVNGGLNMGNRVFMNTAYGVPLGAPVAPGGFSPGAGLRDVHASINMRTPISPQWFWYGGASITRHLGDAARSPLTHQPVGLQLTAGIAYRCCQP